MPTQVCPHTSDLASDFFPLLKTVAARLSADPVHLVSVMMSESGVRAAAHNMHGHASGLIQFMPPTLQGLGWKDGHDAFRLLSATQQLAFVEKYFAPHKGHLGSVGAIYVGTFLPALLKNASNPDFVLTAKEGPLGWAYAPNAVFDTNKDFAITVRELEQAVIRNCRGPRWAEILVRLHGGEVEVFDDFVIDLRTTLGLQRALAKLGFEVGPIDGIPGPKTRAAVLAFQQKHGLTADGIYGPLTRAALESVLAKTTLAPKAPRPAAAAPMKIIRRNDRGPDVRKWQEVLAVAPKPTTWTNAKKEQRTWNNGWGWPLAVDGDFGERTHAATEAWQFARNLTADGIVGPVTWAAAGVTTTATSPTTATEPTEIPFVEARNFTPAQRTGTAIELVVIHAMQWREKGSTAEDCAAMFAHPTSPKTSAHYCVDANSTIQCVREHNVAWHAPGANHNGIGIEHAGFSEQNAAEWADAYSVAMLERSAKLSAAICKRYDIPVVRLSAAELAVKGTKGFCGHIDCTNAFSNGKGHWDPGPAFPWDTYLTRVRHYLQLLKDVDVGTNG